MVCVYRYTDVVLCIFTYIYNINQYNMLILILSHLKKNVSSSVQFGKWLASVIKRHDA